MTTKIISRSPQIDLEKCVAAIGGRYDLILIAAQRSREINRRSRESKTHTSTVDSLLDVQNGLVKLEDYILKIK